MSKLLKVIKGYGLTLNQAVIEIDVDPLAERVVILDRFYFSVIHNHVSSKSRLLRLIVPLSFSIRNDLIVGIIDDTLEYNVKMLDGVQAQIIDGLIIKSKH